MATISDEKDRRVIPNWRSFVRTAKFGELNSTLSRSTFFELPSVSLDEYFSDWKEFKTIAHAGDFLSAAISNNEFGSSKVIEVAEFIIAQPQIASSVLFDSANILLSNFETKKVDEKSHTSGLFEHSNGLSEIYAEIHKYKRMIERYPRNAILYVEIARLYISIGSYQQAIEKINIALFLSPYNRFVVRSAVRLFLHVGDLDRAFFILRKCNKVSDPWLLASEISVSTILKKAQPSIKKGFEIIDSNNFHFRSTAELASSIATVEFLDGSFKKSRKLFEKSLRDPNDNSLAQVQWVNHLKLNVDFDPKLLTNSNNQFEAKAWHEYQLKNYKESIKFSNEWSMDLPFARTPILFAFHISNTHLKDFELSEKILKKGLSANQNDPGLLNDLAYIYALNGKAKEAQEILGRVTNFDQINTDTKICLTATKGLVNFRLNNFAEGRSYYLKAINDSIIAKVKPELNWSAILNYAREELLFGGENIEQLIDVISKIPDDSNDDGIVVLKNEVIELIKNKKS